MAKLVAVCQREEKFPFQGRQIPLVIDDGLTMVMEFANPDFLECDASKFSRSKQAEMQQFIQKFHLLNKDELAVAMMVTSKELFNTLSLLVPCVGCRRSVERMFHQLVQSGHQRALDPLVVTPSAVLSIVRDTLFDARSVFILFNVQGSQLNSMMDNIPKVKKNKRCMLHSLDTQKTKLIGSWLDVWDVLSQECRDEVTVIEADALMETTEVYLRKHRFCTECKSKVMRAYSILIGEVDSCQEKGYCPTLYEGLRCCPQERHVHVLCDTEFIAQLITRAEPDLNGGRRERHAKTIDIAQEEVLTCLGIQLYERLYRIWQKLRAEEQTWQILFYLGVTALKKSFEVAIEDKQGVTMLELVCEEINEAEKAKQQRKEQKKQRKKAKKKNRSESAEDLVPTAEPEIPRKSKPKCTDSKPLGQCAKANCQKAVDRNDNTDPCDTCELSKHGLKALSSTQLTSTCHCEEQEHKTCNGYGEYSPNDGGYCSESSSESHSKDCQENHNPQQAGELVEGVNSECLCSENGKSSKSKIANTSDGLNGVCRICQCTDEKQLHKAMGWTAKLEDMLEDPCSSDEENCISEEEIKLFTANRSKVTVQRKELREVLKQRFNRFYQDGAAVDETNQPAADVACQIGKVGLN
ncbi:gametogenetin-binding protein 2-like [Saccoglossus kowalevskii]|uniref:Gametogenetin-binding protein 2-like n=1 Tax=Saccoglossus kowalevskii TaxID=10224 RepID=A0ABM0GIZ6_SACKO|nr:PREDICTED: gametogenetin-binding protein 2-like [Saccoglossus kowalevskii]